MRGVTKISNSALLSVRCLLRNRCAGKRDVTEVRYLLDRLPTFSFIDTAKNHCLAISNQNLGLDGASIDTRYRAAQDRLSR